MRTHSLRVRPTRCAHRLAPVMLTRMLRGLDRLAEIPMAQALAPARWTQGSSFPLQWEWDLGLVLPIWEIRVRQSWRSAMGHPRYLYPNWVLQIRLHH